MDQPARARLGAALTAGGAVALFVSLFLTWSSTGLDKRHFLELFGAVDRLRGALAGHDAWQTYSLADILLAALAAGLLVVAVTRYRLLRISAEVLALAGLAFCVRALVEPPTAVEVRRLGIGGFALVFGSSAGAGEVVAVVALVMAVVGLALVIRSHPR